MTNKQKKLLLSGIYKSVYAISFIAMLFLGFVSIYGLTTKIAGSYKWVDIALLAFISVNFIFLIIDVVLTRRLKNKYNLMKLSMFVSLKTIVLTLIAYIVLYFVQIDALYVDYYTGLLIINCLVSVLVFTNIIVGSMLQKLYKSTTITIDSATEVPNFDDELALKKKLLELDRKAEFKKMQQKIHDIENSLDD